MPKLLRSTWLVVGPIDPQINGVPARSIKNGFDNVRKVVKDEGPEALPPYIPLIEKYDIHLLELCEDFATLSKNLVIEWMTNYMFAGEANMTEKISKAADYFSDYDTHKIHSRPLFFQKIAALGLKIEESKPEDKLTSLLWEIFVLLEGFFEMTPFAKIYESSQGDEGVSW